MSGHVRVFDTEHVCVGMCVSDTEHVCAREEASWFVSTIP
jgi:hypothetical protein